VACISARRQCRNNAPRQSGPESTDDADGQVSLRLSVGLTCLSSLCNNSAADLSAARSRDAVLRIPGRMRTAAPQSAMQRAGTGGAWSDSQPLEATDREWVKTPLEKLEAPRLLLEGVRKSVMRRLVHAKILRPCRLLVQSRHSSCDTPHAGARQCARRLLACTSGE
jgi:hypothetical protein